MYFYLLFVFIVLMGLFVLLKVWIYWMDLLGSSQDREVKSMFECGFDGKDLSRFPFSLRFFFMMILFLMFDMEMCLLVQLPYDNVVEFYYSRMWYMFFFLMIVLGVLVELKYGLLVWKK